MKKIISFALIGIIAASVAYGDSVRTWTGDDGAPVFRVRNSGTEIVSLTSAEASLIVTNGTVPTTIALSETYTVAQLKAAIEACTNSAGKRTLEVDANCSLAADLVSNKMVAATITLFANDHSFNAGNKWDSSVALHFDAYYPAASKGGVNDAKTLSRVFGDIGGTGDITFVGYVNGVEAFSWRTVSPIYVMGAGNVTNASEVGVADSITPGVFNKDMFNFPVGRDESLLIRATRASTATDNGGIGFVLDLKD